MTRARLVSVAGRLSLVALVCAALGGSAAWADEDVAKVEKLYAQGATLFNSGRYKEALGKFKEAYETYPAANLLFNIARCHEALGKVDLALEAFRRFVAQPGVDPNTKALAERKIKDLEEARRESAARARTEISQREQRQETAPGQTAAKAEPVSYTPWQYIAMGAGAAMIGGGVAAMILGMKDEDEIATKREQQPRPTLAELQDLQDSADTKKLVGYILTGVGAASLITGGVLLVLELTSDGERSAAKSGDKPAVAFGFAPLLVAAQLPSWGGSEKISLGVEKRGSPRPLS